ncbi:MAG: stage II sporulation protein M, partial [Micrococcales bacterium]|nr:stage II sporulation protein M [Micrococcales bacterium]
MDLDALVVVRTPAWQRLDALTRTRHLTGAQCDELVRLYRAVSTDLSAVRSSAPDPDVVARLSQLLGRARARVAGSPEARWSMVTRFVVVLLPAALYRLRWWTCGVAVAFVALAVITGWWVATNPAALNAMGPPDVRQQYVDQAFTSYYDPSAGFAAMVWSNNFWLTWLCIGGGITGVVPAGFLGYNAIGIGASGGLMAAYGHLAVFLQLVAPHGLMELTSVFIAGAAGLRLFWTWLDPGPRPRGRALAGEGRALITVAIGLVATLAVSGVVEAFVTGSALPWGVKIAIGAVVVSAFWVYTLVLGRRA